jgi:2-polyprenyl-6-methoxyphenol hydroxylase-like FAD-dependent oxidoreductase
MFEAPRAEIEVLVVGAGPVGLAMGCALLRQGVSCLVIDRNDGPPPLNESRALGIQARTLEVFETLGVVDTVMAQGRKAHGVGGYADGRRIFHLRLELDETDTRFPFALVLPQSQTERLLLERLGALGGAVERGANLDSFAHDATGVVAQIETPSGRREVRAAWMIGCDGARSAVRQGLGLAFEGGEYEERFLLADLHVGWSMPDDEGAVLFTSEGPILAFPLPGAGRWRLIDPTGIVDTDDPDRIVARFREVVHAHAAADAVVDDAVWTSSFHLHRRVVDHVRVGRCFVAGDAAHLHSPAGGQGMNTGIQDAFNLAWKLALVLRGRAPDALLDSYEAERRPVALGVLKGSEALTRMVTLRDPLARDLRDVFLSLVTEIGFARRRLSLGASELAIAYRDSPIVAEDREGLLRALRPVAAGSGMRGYLSFAAAPRAGDRAPNVAFTAPGANGAERLFDVLQGTTHSLLMFAGDGARIDEAFGAVAHLVRDHYDGLIKPLVVSTEVRSDRPLAEIPLIHDAQGTLHARFGARSACLYLIRPDGYVGYRALAPDVYKLRAYLERLFIHRESILTTGTQIGQ